MTTTRPVNQKKSEGGFFARLEHPMLNYQILLGATGLLLTLGIVMVASASSVFSYQQNNGNSWALATRQLVFAIIGVVVLGAPMWLVLLYQSVSVVLTQFNHANIRIPKWFDQTVGLILVSPNMHRVHHHVTRPQTDANYGNIFSFWDRLFGTYDSTNMKDIVYGLDVVDNSRHADISYQLRMPFDKSIQSDY